MGKQRYHKFDPIGRDREIERIVRFLKIEGGGSLLLGGDRGSGKTKLVNMAIDRYGVEAGFDRHQQVLGFLPKNPRSLTMANIIKIHIPLIIIDSKDDKQKNDYRSMLMRAMLIGLEADLARRYYSQVDLPKRWFSAIGYVQSVYALRPYAHYLKLSKNTSKTLGVSSNYAVTPAMQSALTAEIDLTDSTLEIKLRNMLTEYSRIHTFIFIFDELDKLPPSIELETIVLYLKNLFSETGVHAIFISSEKDLKRVMKKSSSESTPLEESTLFVDLVLLNNMKLDELTRLIKERVNINEDDPDTDINQLIYGLALRTNKSPNELNKFLARHGTEYNALIHGLKTELGNEKFSKFAVMQVFINHVLEKYTGLYDEHFDRLLEEALQQAGTIILEAEGALVHDINTRTLFYTSDYFTEAGVTAAEALANEKKFKQGEDKYKPTSTPDIVERIDALNEDQCVSTLYAVEHLVVLLNRADQLSITATDTNTVVKLGKIQERSFAHSKLKDINLDERFELKETEQATLATIKKYNPPYRVLTGGDMYGSTYIVKLDGTERTLEAEAGLYTFANSTLYWSLLQQTASRAQEMLLRKMVAHLKSRTNPAIVYSSVVYKNKTAVIEFKNGIKIKLVLLFENQRFNADPLAAKMFIFRDESATFRHKSVMKNIKHLPMKTEWSNIKASLNVVAKWINESLS